jgi:putative hemolysin
MVKKKRKDLVIVAIAIIIILLCLSLVCFFLKKDSSQIANPASVYCEDNGGRLDIRTNEEGQYGVCIKEGAECEEWAFYRGECVL